MDTSISYASKEPTIKLDDLNSRERSKIQEALLSAAKITGLKIDAATMIVVSRDDFYATVAIVTSDECDMFGYLVFPQGTEVRRCVGPDFYLFDITLDCSGKTGTAELRALNGNIVLNGLPVEVQEVPGDAPNRAGLSLELNHNEFKPKRWKPDGGQTPGLHFADIITIRF